jgi:hypothetical protein
MTALVFIQAIRGNRDNFILHCDVNETPPKENIRKHTRRGHDVSVLLNCGTIVHKSYAKAFLCRHGVHSVFVVSMPPVFTVVLYDPISDKIFHRTLIIQTKIAISDTFFDCLNRKLIIVFGRRRLAMYYIDEKDSRPIKVDENMISGYHNSIFRKNPEVILNDIVIRKT